MSAGKCRQWISCLSSCFKCTSEVLRPGMLFQALKYVCIIYRFGGALLLFCGYFGVWTNVSAHVWSDTECYLSCPCQEVSELFCLRQRLSLNDANYFFAVFSVARGPCTLFSFIHNTATSILLGTWQNWVGNNRFETHSPLICDKQIRAV